jgi:hypothetical protein
MSVIKLSLNYEQLNLSKRYCRLTGCLAMKCCLHSPLVIIYGAGYCNGNTLYFRSPGKTRISADLPPTVIAFRGFSRRPWPSSCIIRRYMLLSFQAETASWSDHPETGYVVKNCFSTCGPGTHRGCTMCPRGLLFSFVCCTAVSFKPSCYFLLSLWSKKHEENNMHRQYQNQHWYSRSLLQKCDRR